MTFFGGLYRATTTGQGKRVLLFTSRAYSQLVQSQQKDNARSKETMKKLCLINGDVVKRMFQIMNTRFASDLCGEKPGTCHLTTPIEPCEQIKLPKWKSTCDKICLPCCKPIKTPVRCNRELYSLNLCSGTEYKYPSYAQTIETIDCGIFKSDCCYPPPCKGIYPMGYVKKLLPIKERQKQKLGVPHGSKRYFSTSAGLSNNKCDPQPKGKESPKKLPCLVLDPKASKKEKKGAEIGDCLKVCMPCCKPARDPPTCAFPYQKPPCKRAKPPRPAFSECQARKAPAPEPCECQYIVLKRCAMGGDDDDGKGKCKKKK